jgi:hypothetical protein
MVGPNKEGAAVARKFRVDSEGVADSDTQETPIIIQETLMNIQEKPMNVPRVLGLGGIGVALLAGTGAVLAAPAVGTAAAAAATGYAFHRATRRWRSR